MRHPFAPAFAALALAANTPVPDMPQSPPPSPAIVGGHHIQPRASTSNRGTADVPPAEADEVERLYQQLMRQTAPDSSPGGSGVPAR
jgi:hypothetical protein